MRKKFFAFIAAALVMLTAASQTSHAQGTAFTYLGGMNVSGQPANGLYDFQFYLRDAASDGNAVGTTNFITAVSVTNGQFGVTLDFGANFPGAARWLEIGVQPSGGTHFTVLTPRQQILATPYAVFAGASGSANVAAQAGSFSGTLSGNVIGAQGATLVTAVGGVSASSIASGATAANAATDASVPNTIVKRAADGSFLGNAQYLTNLSTTNLIGVLQPAQGMLPMPSIFFYGAKGGTNDDSAAFTAAEASGMPVYCPPSATYTFTNLFVTHNGFEIIGENTLLKFNTNCQGNFISVATNVVGFQLRGVILDGQMQGFESIGGTKAWFEDPQTNVNKSTQGYRTGLFASAMQTNGVISHVTAQNFSDAGFRFIGGAGVIPEPSMPAMTFDNNIGLNNWIGLDFTNNAEYMVATAYQARQNGWGVNIAAGNTMIIGGDFEDNGVGAVIAGGANPAHGVISASSFKHDSVGFIVQDTRNGFEFADCEFDAVGPCYATNFSGLNIHGGVFQPIPCLIVDGTGGTGGVNKVEHTLYLGAPPQIITTHGGLCVYNENFNQIDLTGVLLETNAMSMTFTRPMVAMGITNLGALNVMTQIPVSTNTTNLIATFANTNQPVSWLDDKGNWYASGNFNANTFVNLSDRNAKEDFRAVSAREILDKVAALPISNWSYKSNSGDRHIGPMAQDFYAAFGLGADDRHITTVDETGIALTAIQGLNDELNEKNAKIADLEKRLDTLETMVRELKK